MNTISMIIKKELQAGTDEADHREVKIMTEAMERQTVEELFNKLPPDKKVVFTTFIKMNAAAMMMLLSVLEQTNKKAS